MNALKPCFLSIASGFLGLGFTATSVLAIPPKMPARCESVLVSRAGVSEKKTYNYNLTHEETALFFNPYYQKQLEAFQLLKESQYYQGLIDEFYKTYQEETFIHKIRMIADFTTDDARTIENGKTVGINTRSEFKDFLENAFDKKKIRPGGFFQFFKRAKSILVSSKKTEFDEVLSRRISTALSAHKIYSDEFVLRAVAFAKYKTSKFPAFEKHDELDQIAFEGLINAALRYHPNLAEKRLLTTHLDYQIHRALEQYDFQDKNMKWLDQTLSEDDDTTLMTSGKVEALVYNPELDDREAFKNTVKKINGVEISKLVEKFREEILKLTNFGKAIILYSTGIDDTSLTNLSREYAVTDQAILSGEKRLLIFFTKIIEDEMSAERDLKVGNEMVQYLWAQNQEILYQRSDAFDPLVSNIKHALAFKKKQLIDKLTAVSQRVYRKRSIIRHVKKLLNQKPESVSQASRRNLRKNVIYKESLIRRSKRLREYIYDEGNTFVENLNVYIRLTNSIPTPTTEKQLHSTLISKSLKQEDIDKLSDLSDEEFELVALSRIPGLSRRSKPIYLDWMKSRRDDQAMLKINSHLETFASIPSSKVHPTLYVSIIKRSLTQSEIDELSNLSEEEFDIKALERIPGLSGQAKPIYLSWIRSRRVDKVMAKINHHLETYFSVPQPNGENAGIYQAIYDRSLHKDEIDKLRDLSDKEFESKALEKIPGLSEKAKPVYLRWILSKRIDLATIKLNSFLEANGVMPTKKNRELYDIVKRKTLSTKQIRELSGLSDNAFELKALEKLYGLSEKSKLIYLNWIKPKRYDPIILALSEYMEENLEVPKPSLNKNLHKAMILRTLPQKKIEEFSYLSDEDFQKMVLERFPGLTEKAKSVYWNWMKGRRDEYLAKKERLFLSAQKTKKGDVTMNAINSHLETHLAMPSSVTNKKLLGAILERSLTKKQIEGLSELSDDDFKIKALEKMGGLSEKSLSVYLNWIMPKRKDLLLDKVNVYLETYSKIPTKASKELYMCLINRSLSREEIKGLIGLSESEFEEKALAKFRGLTEKAKIIYLKWMHERRYKIMSEL